jgi:hypothetical protein
MLAANKPSETVGAGLNERRSDGPTHAKEQDGSAWAKRKFVDAADPAKLGYLGRTHMLKPRSSPRAYKKQAPGSVFEIEDQQKRAGMMRQSSIEYCDSPDRPEFLFASDDPHGSRDRVPVAATASIYAASRESRAVLGSLKNLARPRGTTAEPKEPSALVRRQQKHASESRAAPLPNRIMANTMRNWNNQQRQPEFTVTHISNVPMPKAGIQRGGRATKLKPLKSKTQASTMQNTG